MSVACHRISASLDGNGSHHAQQLVGYADQVKSPRCIECESDRHRLACVYVLVDFEVVNREGVKLAFRSQSEGDSFAHAERQLGWREGIAPASTGVLEANHC